MVYLTVYITTGSVLSNACSGLPYIQSGYYIYMYNM